jgi:hypothetical protein
MLLGFESGRLGRKSERKIENSGLHLLVRKRKCRNYAKNGTLKPVKCGESYAGCDR